MGHPRASADAIVKAVSRRGSIKEETAKRLLALIAEKTDHEVHLCVEVVTKTMVKTIDNEEDAQETIRRLELRG